jgi:hypothetical protein
MAAAAAAAVLSRPSSGIPCLFLVFVLFVSGFALSLYAVVQSVALYVTSPSGYFP